MNSSSSGRKICPIDLKIDIRWALTGNYTQKFFDIQRTEKSPRAKGRKTVLSRSALYFFTNPDPTSALFATFFDQFSKKGAETEPIWVPRYALNRSSKAPHTG